MGEAVPGAGVLPAKVCNLDQPMGELHLQAELAYK